MRSLEIPPISKVQWRLLDWTHNEITHGEASVNMLYGTFDTSIYLPPNVKRGDATISFKSEAPMSNNLHIHSIRIQEVKCEI